MKLHVKSGLWYVYHVQSNGWRICKNPECGVEWEMPDVFDKEESVVEYLDKLGG